MSTVVHQRSRRAGALAMHLVALYEGRGRGNEVFESSILGRERGVLVKCSCTCPNDLNPHSAYPLSPCPPGLSCC